MTPQVGVSLWTLCFKPYKGVSSNSVELVMCGLPPGFKPYKGVSSNVWMTINSWSYLTVSNPIREYLQISKVVSLIFFILVSNPIREYLQIHISHLDFSLFLRFKPYKGVSSNFILDDSEDREKCFKPYKGVSSNSKVSNYYNGVQCFKPYKGVSSNLRL